jgi:hypothetical protein
MANRNGLMSGIDVCTSGFKDSNIYVRKSDLQNTSSYTAYLIGTEACPQSIFADTSANFTVPYTGNYMLEATLVIDAISNITNVAVIGTTLKDVSTGVDNEYGDTASGSSFVKPPAGANPNVYPVGLLSTHTLTAGTTYNAGVFIRDSAGIAPPSTFACGLVLSISSF